MRCALLSIITLTGVALGFENSPRPKKTIPPDQHWAFKMPAADDQSIDNLINANLKKTKLTPAPQAPRQVLLRRTFHVLTGLLPTPSERKTWLADPRPDWLAHLTTALLARP
ncbi:MAG: hypothetical protein ACJA1W_004699, partial [Akkermansiaceae bacterium]